MKSTMQREDEVGKRDGGKNNDFPYKVKKIRLRGNNQQARSDNTKKRTKKAKKGPILSLPPRFLAAFVFCNSDFNSPFLRRFFHFLFFFSFKKRSKERTKINKKKTPAAALITNAAKAFHRHP